MKKKIRLVQQLTQNECGVCCVSMVASYYGYYKPIRFFRNELDAGRDGTSLYDLISILDKIGLRGEAYRGGIEQITDRNIPIICFVNNSHYVVVFKDKKNRLTVFDPEKGKENYTYDKFNTIYSGYCIVVKQDTEFYPEKEKEHPWKYFIEILKNTIPLFIKVLILSIITYILTLLIPITIQSIVDNVVIGERNIKIYFFLALIFLIAYLGTSLIRDRYIVFFEKDADFLLTNKVMSHLLNIPYKFFERRRSGDLLFRINLLSSIKSTMSNGIILAIIDTGTLIFAIGLMFSYSFEIGLIVLLILTILFGFIKIMNGKIVTSNQSEIEKSSVISAKEVEIITGIFTIKSMGIEDSSFDDFSKSYLEYIEAFGKREKYTKYNNTILSTFQIFIPLVVFVIGVYINENSNAMSMGQTVSLYSIASIIISKAISVFQNYTNILLMKNMLIRVNDILDEEIEVIPENPVEIEKIHSISLSNVDFSYSSSEKSEKVLKDISLTIKKGESIAIVGESGSGKSTLMKILAGLQTPTSGDVRFNGISYKNLKMKDIRRTIGIVPQDVTLFNKTIRENISLSSLEVDDDDIEYALEMASINSEINKLPMKLNTIVSEFGNNLSGGQRQRIAIARALAKKPSYIIFDEATSSLDNINEKNINDHLVNVNCTKIVIAHRLSTIRNVDKIYVMKNGRIIEMGSHDELIKNQEYYYELYYSQGE